jgi:hypothetical protein
MNLLLAGVKASPEVSPIAETMNLSPKLNTEIGNLNTVSLEKRGARHLYNFGIGKKSYSIDTIDEDIGHEDDSYDEMQEAKRDGRAFGSGKVYYSSPEQRFAFGLGKRSELSRTGKRYNENRFQFGLGKRALRDNRFAFGLGKRENDIEEYIKRRYSFGLGKRSAQHS